MKKKIQSPPKRKQPQTQIQSNRLLPLSIFSIVAYIILAVFHNDYLYTAESHSLWLNSRHFLEEYMMRPGGLMMWAGCYLTQFFYFPYIGSLILVTLWSFIYILTIKAFSIKKELSIIALFPVIALLCSVISLGYWLYYNKIPGYWFTESIGMVTTLLAITIAKVTRPLPRLIWMMIFGIGGYALIGWYALLGTLVIVINTAIYNKEEKTKALWAHLVLAFIAIVATPLLWYQHYTTIRIEDAWWAAFPVFQSNDIVSLKLSVPFILIALTFILLPIILRYNSTQKKHHTTIHKPRHLAINLSATATYCLMVYSFWYGDNNFRAELKMMRALEKRDWNTIIDIAETHEGHPTKQMTLIRDIALLNTGQLGDRMFTFDNTTILPTSSDSLPVRMVRAAGPEIYLQYGKTNFAYRWCIENGVEYGYNVNHLRHLAKCSILNKENNLALKYINLLKRTTLHKKEAMQLEAMVFNPLIVANDEEMTSIINLIDANNFLDADNGLCSLYLMDYFSQVTSHNPVMADLITAYTLKTKNNELFWPRFMNYGILHEGKPIPHHFLEAAYLFGNIDNSPIFNDLQFDITMIQNYSNFRLAMYNLQKKGLTEKEIGEEMKKTFGKTYWWYYYFATDEKFY